MMLMSVKAVKEDVGPVGEEMRTRRKVAVGYLAVVLKTVCMIVERKERSLLVVVVVVVTLLGDRSGRLEAMGWEIDAGERSGMMLAVTKRVIEGRNRRLRSGCIAFRRHEWDRGGERSNHCVVGMT